MKVTIHRGLRQIGGNIIEIESETTKLIIDAGDELEDTLNPLDFQELLECECPDAILISHYHTDHVGLLDHAGNLPKIYMGKRAYELYQKAKEYVGKTLGFSPEGWFINDTPIHIGDIKITPYLADHSALDAYSLLFECDGKKVFYTGDFRGHGRKSYERYLRMLPDRVDAIMCEGTTLNRAEKKNVSESQLEALMTAEIGKCTNQVFILASAMNIDRMVTVYKAAKRNNRIFLQDIYVSSLTELCQDIHIPNPVTFSDVYAFTFDRLSSEAHDRIRTAYGRKFIGREAIALSDFLMCIRSNSKVREYLHRLNEIKSLAGSLLLYSMWEGYKRKPEMQAFLKDLEGLGIRCCSVHTSGHADADDVRRLIEKTNPEIIIPIHTENEEWFLDEYAGTRKVYTKRFLEV